MTGSHNAVRAIRLATVAGTALVTMLSTIAPADAATPNPVAQATYQTNGTVYAIAYSGSSVYIGGSFTAVRPAGSSTGNVARNNVAAFDSTTGNVLPWNPNANNTVRAIAISGSTVYLGGLFTTIGGQARSKLAAVDATTAAPLAWNPGADSHVRALTLSADGSTLYAGGAFTTIGGVQRLHAAALDASTGAVLGWRADATGTTYPTVNAIAVGGSTVYLGGSFSAVNGVSRVETAAVAASDGQVLAWKAKTPYTILAVAYSSSVVVAVGRGPGGFVGGFDPTTGAQLWSSPTDGDVQALVIRGSECYIGGHFLTVKGVSRVHIAALATSTGALLSWDPGANSDIGVESLASDSGHVAAGGAFTVVGSRAQQGFGQFAG